MVRTSARNGSPEAGPTLGPPGTGWLRRTLPLLGGERKKLGAVVIFAVVSMVAAASTPVVIRRTIDHALLEDQPLMPWLLAIVGMGVIRFISGFLMRYQSGLVSLRLEFDLRTMLFEHLQSLDLATHDTIQTGQLTSRANTDVRILQMFLAWMPVLFSSLAMTLISLGVMISWSPILALVATLPLPLVIFVAIRMRERLFPAAWDSQQRTADIADVVDDAVSGVRVIRAFGQEERELHRLKDKAVALFKAQMRVTRFSSRYMPAMNLIPSLGLVLLLLVGGSMVKSGEITVGQFLAFNSYVLMMVAPIQMLGFFIALGQRARASAERILEIFDSVPTIVDAPDAKELVVNVGEVVFSKVKFGYVPSAPVLNGLDLRIRPGQRVAVVGGNRSGKSTLTTLLPRFYDPQEGSVLIDGKDIRGVTLASLRRQVGIVFEESFLFSGTIRENIAYGRPDATDEEIRTAAEAAGAHDFISTLQNRYETEVGESGFSVSGGQRQRIALARALLGDPKILVLDDATSSVDVKTEAEILAALADLLEGRTTILVASRPSTVALADRVVLLEQGKVADEGTHLELLERSSLYRELMGHADDAAIVQPVAASLMMGAAVAGSAEGPDGSPRAQAAMKRQADALSGRGDNRGALWISSMPATPELLAKVAALPVAPDEPKIDFDEAAVPEVGFKPRRVIRKFAGAITFGLLLLVLRTAFQLSGPKFAQYGIDGTLSPARAAGLFLLAILLQGLVMWRATIWTLRIGERALLWIRVKVFSHLQRMSIDFFDKELSGKIMSRMTSDIDSFGTFIQEALFNILISFLTLFGAVMVLLFTEARLALVVLLGVIPALLGFTQWFRKASERAYLKVRDRIAAVLGSLQEGIAGVRVSQAFVKEGTEAEDFRRLSSDLHDARKDGVLYSSIFFPGVDAIGVLSQAAVIGAAGYLLSAGRVTAAIVVAFVLYLNQFFAPIQQLSQLFDSYQQAKAAASKLDDLMRVPSATPMPTEGVVPAEAVGAMTFSNVKFGYFEGGEVLHGIDLEVPAGERLALVGKTGAGKSTLIKLAARFYDPTEGSIAIDGVDLKDMDPGFLRRFVGVVPQEPFLFTGTIRDNIAYGRPDASDDEIRAAAALVGADAIFDSSAEGFQTQILGRGRGLSAGEKQLIALARVALADPRVLLLDEPTSRLDLQTEGQILKALNNLIQGRTCLIIAHRLSTVKGADRIVVMEQGRVAELGTHDELLTRGGIYADLYERWEGVPAEALTGPA